MFGHNSWTHFSLEESRVFSANQPYINDSSPAGGGYWRFTENAANGLGFITNAPTNADLTQIPRITTSIFGTIALQYPSGVGDGDLQGSTKAEVIASAKQKALQDDYGYGPYWIDELTTFGCTDPEAENYCEDCDYSVGDWYCAYGCDDEYRKTDYLGNCLADCEDGYELVKASQVKPAKCVAIEELKQKEETETTPPITTQTTTTEPIATTESPNYALYGVISLIGVIIALPFFKKQ